MQIRSAVNRLRRESAQMSKSCCTMTKSKPQIDSSTNSQQQPQSTSKSTCDTNENEESIQIDAGVEGIIANFSSPDNVFEWDAYIQGPENSNFEFGIFHAKLTFPKVFLLTTFPLSE